MNENKLAFLFGDSIEADYAFKSALLLAEEKAKEESWKEKEEKMKENEEKMKENEEKMKENEEKMKENDERMKEYEERMNIQDKEMKHLKRSQQQAIQNIMKVFNISEKDALALFHQTSQ